MVNTVALSEKCLQRWVTHNKGMVSLDGVSNIFDIHVAKAVKANFLTQTWEEVLTLGPQMKILSGGPSERPSSTQTFESRNLLRWFCRWRDHHMFYGDISDTKRARWIAKLPEPTTCFIAAGEDMTLSPANLNQEVLSEPGPNQEDLFCQANFWPVILVATFAAIWIPIAKTCKV